MKKIQETKNVRCVLKHKRY